MNAPNSAGPGEAGLFAEVDPHHLPIIYIRGYAGPTAGIDTMVDDPFYGFNLGATHVRVNGDGDPLYYQFEGPMLRLMIDEGYQLLVRGDQSTLLDQAEDGTLSRASIWVYRFYDQAATTFTPPPKEGFAERVVQWFHHHVSADGFDIESAAEGLYTLIGKVLGKTGAPKVYLVAHSMGGLIARCMIQKVCQQDGRDRATDLVASLFTYGTPHGGISTDSGALNWAEEAFGPAGADIFAPDKMFGYLTEGKDFGDTPARGDNWDPQFLDPAIFDPGRVFCVVGTDAKDYGAARIVVGPRSDGLVRIEHAYVRGAHRAYVYKSHSGRYGEVNSEEGYQNLRRFLFGRWQVQLALKGLVPVGTEQDGRAWQADMRLAVRGLSVVMSEQLAEHWCPIQLNEELGRPSDSTDHPVPLLSTFLLDPRRQVTTAAPPAGPVPHQGRARHVLTLRVYAIEQQGSSFQFADHLEQVPDWADSLIVDVGPDTDGEGFYGWAEWNHNVPGPNSAKDPISDHKLKLSEPVAGVRTAVVPLPEAARALPILGQAAYIQIQLTDRSAR